MWCAQQQACCRDMQLQGDKVQGGSKCRAACLPDMLNVLGLQLLCQPLQQALLLSNCGLCSRARCLDAACNELLVFLSGL